MTRSSVGLSFSDALGRPADTADFMIFHERKRTVKGIDKFRPLYVVVPWDASATAGIQRGHNPSERGSVTFLVEPEQQPLAHIILGGIWSLRLSTSSASELNFRTRRAFLP